MASPQSEPDVLTVGLGEAGRLSRRGKFVLVALGLALLAGLMVWRFLPARAPLFSLSDVQGVYAGMVRSDGTNRRLGDRSSLEQRTGWVHRPGRLWTVVRGDCVEPPPARSARRSQHLLGARSFGGLALHLSVRRRGESGPRVQSAGHSARQLRSSSCGGARAPGEQRLADPYAAGSRQRSAAQIGYVLTNNAGAKLAIHVLAFSNTVSWQFRYEPVPGTYLPLTAQRVMDSLTDQMRAVQDLNR